MQLLTSTKKGKESTQKNLMLITFLMILLGIGYTYQYLLPNYKKAKQDNEFFKAQKVSAEQDLASLQKVDANLTKGKTELESRGVDLEKVKRVYPGTENMPEVFIQMEQIKEENKAIEPQIQISNPTIAQTDNSAKIPLIISAQGSLADIGVFIDRLKNNIRPVVITAISYSVPQTIDGQVNTNFILQATGYIPIKAISEVYSGN